MSHRTIVAHRCTRVLALLSAIAFAGVAAAASWSYLDGPFGGQALTLYNDAAGNTWAGMNGAGVYYRAAGSGTWTLRPGVPTQSNYQIAIGGTGIVYTAGSAGVFALAPGAATWERVSGANGLPGQAGGGLISDAQGAIYAGMNNTGAVYKLAAGATQWAALGTGLPANTQVGNLVLDGSGNLWASISGQGVYKLAAGGATWVAVNTGLDKLSITAMIVVGNDLFLGIQFGGAFKLTGASTGGTVWAPWNGGALAAGDAIYDFSKGLNNTLYAAGYGKVYVLAGGAANWTTLGTGIDADGPGYAIVYSTVDGSLTLSSGAGVKVLAANTTAWQPANSGMTALTVYGLAVAPNGDVYAATFGLGVYKLAGGTGAWTAVDPAHTTPSTLAVIIDGTGTVYATSANNVLKLTGATWSVAGSNASFPYTLAIDPANNVWLGGSGVVQKLATGSVTWANMGTGLPANQSVSAIVFDNAGTAYAGLYGGGVYRLTQGSATWVATNGGLTNLNVRSLARDAGGTVHVGNDTGVFKLQGTAWVSAGTGISGPVEALIFDGSGDLFAGVDNAYIWRLPAGAAAWVQTRLGLASRSVPAFAVGGGKLYAGTDASRGAPSGVFRYQPLPTVVEFHNTTLDHFFITADAAEQAAVAGGAAGPGWEATGSVFPAGGGAQVCRFYGSITPGPNSHFYTIDPAECQQLKDIQATTPASQKRWNFESNDFASSRPVNGQCAAGLVPVYRAYNNGFSRNVDSNHRITADFAGYQAQIAAGWIGEGVVMCAPK